MKPEELHSFTQDLIAQSKILEDNLLELAVFSGGSVTYNDLLQMPVSQVKSLQSIITKKLKQEKGVKDQMML